ncbi:hypothetical protein GGF31_007062 [Allomyces arbusculus]|nr:hypothetical protein GGF31_007062 [Allomyces arbusculus]
MPALETFRMARIQEPQRLVEWRLAYVEGNPIWSVVPMTQAKNQIAEKLVVGVSVVNDVERMAAEIKNMAYWCAESSLLVDGILVHQNGVGEEDWFPVEVHVVPEAGSQVQQRVEQLVEELREQYEIAARVMYVSAPLP